MRTFIYGVESTLKYRIMLQENLCRLFPDKFILIGILTNREEENICN